jgi:hypothetical protein
MICLFVLPHVAEMTGDDRSMPPHPAIGWEGLVNFYAPTGLESDPIIFASQIVGLRAWDTYVIASCVMLRNLP